MVSTQHPRYGPQEVPLDLRRVPLSGSSGEADRARAKAAPLTAHWRQGAMEFSPFSLNEQTHLKVVCS